MAVFATSNFEIFRGSMPPDPLAGSPFGRGSGLRPLNFRTQVPTFRTQVETGLGKTLDPVLPEPNRIFGLLNLSTTRKKLCPIHFHETRRGWGRRC